MVVPLDASAAPRRKERACKGERQQHQRGNPQREEQQLSKVPALRVFHRRVLQQLDRGELHPRLGLALQQMQHDRNGGSKRARKKHRCKKSQHATASP